MTAELVKALDIREGDKILAASPQYHGPTFTVETVTSNPYIVRPHNGPSLRIAGRYGAQGEHPATLGFVRPDRTYLVERAS